MYWKDKKVEQQECDFVKVLMNLKVGLEWCLSESIFKEEPQDEKLKFKWALLWNRIKRQNGIRCTSTRKNRRLGGLFKCLQEKLPVLKILAKQCEDLYKESKYISCKDRKEENQDHLLE